MTRLFDAHIIASEETFAEVRGRVQHRELGTSRLKGIKQRAALYDIVARGQAVSVGTPA
jgi:class 3 adenylate cyclase